ncbi:unnamed protein product [Mucor hiemalis]
MEHLHPNWKTLPVEILHKTFSAIEQRHLPESPFRFEFAAKKLFTYHATKANIRKECQVFQVSLLWQTITEEVTSIATLLSGFFPNLQSLTVRRERFSYVPVLNALLESHLTRLKTIHEPTLNLSQSEVATYTTCALLMRDRLETLHIFDNYKAITEAAESRLYFDRLYSKLHQFDKVNNLIIKLKTNFGIQVLDNIVESCKALEQINFNFVSSIVGASSQRLSLDDSDPFAKFTPRSNIKSINGTMYIPAFSLIFSYIMHKFSQLQSIYLYLVTDSITTIDPQTITLLFKYLSKFDKYSVSNLTILDEDLCDTIGEYWKSSSKLGSQHVTIHNGKEFIADGFIFLNVAREKGSTHTELYAYDLEEIHVSFIENYGRYIESLIYGFRVDEEEFGAASTDFNELPEHLILHLLKHCPHLKSLRIEGSILRQPSFFEIDMTYKFSLSKLAFDHCVIHAGVLEQLSLLVPKLDRLIIGYNVRYRRYGNDVLTQEEESITEEAIEINMPHTTIDTLVVFQMEENDPLNIKLYSVSEQKFYLFTCDYDFEDGKNGTEMLIKSITEEEEIASRSDLGRRVYISCQNVPRFLLDE